MGLQAGVRRGNTVGPLPLAQQEESSLWRLLCSPVEGLRPSGVQSSCCGRSWAVCESYTSATRRGGMLGLVCPHPRCPPPQPPIPRTTHPHPHPHTLPPTPNTPHPPRPQVRSAALHVWKKVVTNTRKTRGELLPALMGQVIASLADPGGGAWA